MCGGYASNSPQMKSLQGKVSGLKTFSLTYQTQGLGMAFKADLEEGTLSSSISVHNYSAELGGTSVVRKMTKEEGQRLAEEVFSGGLLELNGYSVQVNGLPLIEDCFLSMTFEEGESYSMNFNGGRGPGKFREAFGPMIPLLMELGEYAPGKGAPLRPYPSSVLGTHVFEFEEDGKKGTLTVRIESLHKREGVLGQGELFSEGDFGKKHFRIDVRPISGNGEYHLEMVKEYEDSVGKTPENWTFAATIKKDYKGNLLCEAYSAMPDLNDRKAVPEKEKEERVTSAFLFDASGEEYRTICLYRESAEEDRYFLRTGQEDSESGRFFYSIYRVEPEELAALTELAGRVDPWKVREYFALGSKEPGRSKVWLEMDFLYGRSVILSEEAFREAAERLKDDSIPEEHMELMLQMISCLESLADPRKIAFQGANPSGREVAEYLAEGHFIDRNGSFLMKREWPVTFGEEKSPEELKTLFEEIQKGTDQNGI